LVKINAEKKKAAALAAAANHAKLGNLERIDEVGDQGLMYLKD
jgi:hypothetical protein